MASNIMTDEQRRHFQALLAAAEPYNDDDPILNILDDEEQDYDVPRRLATLAKRMLEMDEAARKEAGLLPNDE